MNKRNLLIGLSVFIVVVFGISFSAYFYRRNYSPRQMTLGPKWVNQAQFAGFFNAQEEGFYRNTGLSLNVKEYTLGTNQLDDLISGKVDFALLSAEEVLIARDKGQPITAVAVFYQVSPYVIVALENSNIESPADFRGKVLGNKGGKIEESIFYRLLLNSVGLDESSVKTKKLDLDTKEIDDLLSGKADAIGLYRSDQLFFFKQRNIPYKLIYPEQFGVNFFNDVLVVKNDFLEKEPKVVHDFVKASVEGWNFAYKNREKTIKNTMKYVTVKDYKDEAYQFFILEQSLPLIKQGGVVGAMNYQKWSRLYMELKRLGFIKGDFEVSSAFSNRYL